MRIAIVSSLQGRPEETSPETPTDTTRIARYVAERLQTALPQVEVNLYDREDYPDRGDCYLQVRADLVRWGADVAVHIHQDASRDPRARGWSVLYCQPEALGLAECLAAALREVSSPSRGISRRCDVAVLKSPAPPQSVLVECGFYAHPADEAIGTVGWGEPVVRGVLNYLQQWFGIQPVKEEVVAVPKIVVPENAVMNGRHVYHVPAFRRDWWLDIGYEGEGVVPVEVWINQQANEGGKKPPARRQVYDVPGTLNPDHAPGVHIQPCRKEDPEWVVLSIHSHVPMTIFVGP